MSASASAAVFALLAALLSRSARSGAVLHPLWRARRGSALVLIAAFTVLAGELYRLVGTPIALDTAMIERPTSLDQAIAQLKPIATASPTRKAG